MGSAAADVLISRWSLCAAKTEQCLKRGLRGSAAIVSEDELVEVHRKLRPADAVVRAYEPALKVTDRAVDNGDDGLYALTQTNRKRLGAREMCVSLRPT